MIVGPYGKSKKKDPNTVVANQDVTVIVINSALTRDEEFFRGYSLVIYDEAHSYCSESRKEIFRKCNTWVCLGMSATTEDRNDGFDPIVHKELAVDGIIRAENIPSFTYEDVAFDCHARILNYSGPAEHA
jgi:superfamily II DNA or RNA helicase